MASSYPPNSPGWTWEAAGKNRQAGCTVSRGCLGLSPCYSTYRCATLGKGPQLSALSEGERED